jgi:hypothetical protein
LPTRSRWRSRRCQRDNGISISEHDHARATADFGDGGNDILAPLFAIVTRTDSDRLDLLLRTNHMFQCGAKFRREAAMGHEDDSNHRTYS